MAFKMNGWSAFTKVDHKKTKHPGDDPKTTSEKLDDEKWSKLPTFRKDDAKNMIDQYDEEGNKRYNIEGEDK